MIKCPECNITVSNNAHRCPACGYPIKEKRSVDNRIICQQCLSVNEKYARFCVTCGSILKNPQPYDSPNNSPNNYANNPYTKHYNTYNTPYNTQYNPSNNTPDHMVRESGLGIASMVLGIISCLSVWIAGIVGLVLGLIALGDKGRKKGCAIAGIITSSAGLIISVIFLIRLLFF
jgi:hypothetical protein